jgi:serine/threonine protein kinase
VDPKDQEHSWKLSLPRLHSVEKRTVGDTYIPPPPQKAVAIPARTQASPTQGTVIASRYRVEERIGEGGMGHVYRVTHLRLGKGFALKLMRAEISADPKLREQFYREARLASSMVHQHIVSIVDFGEDSAWGAFMVMELLAGEPLTDRLRRHGTLPVKAACDVVLQLADALHYIHKQNVVHGDIKPDNVLCDRVSSSERRRWNIKLLDFGLAHIRSHDSEQRAKTVAGTPEYLAPERITGNPPNPSMDVYSLGIVMYELLTGAPPFQGHIETILTGHLHQQPPSVSSKRGEDVDERLEELVARSLAKKPEDRQRSMEAFLYELRTLMDMLGWGRRAGRGKRVTKQKYDAVSQRLEIKARGFDMSPLPMASISQNGSVLVANAAFSAFVAGEPDDSVEGVNLLSTKFVEFHPRLVSDLRQVQMKGVTRKAKLRLASEDGRPVHLLLWLVPSSDDASEILLTLHAIQV